MTNPTTDRIPMPSFFFPPQFTTVDEIFDFFATVDVPDQVIRRTRDTHIGLDRGDVAGIHLTHPELAWNGVRGLIWNRANPDPEDDPDQAHETVRADAKREYVTHLRASLKSAGGPLYGHLYEPLARLVATYDAILCEGGIDLISQDDLLDAMTREVRIGDNTDTLVDAVVYNGMSQDTAWIARQYNYALDGVASDADAIVERVTEVISTKVHEIVWEAINHQNVQLDGALDELTDNLGNVQESILNTLGQGVNNQRQVRRASAVAGAVGGMAAAALRGRN